MNEVYSCEIQYFAAPHFAGIIASFLWGIDAVFPFLARVTRFFHEDLEHLLFLVLPGSVLLIPLQFFQAFFTELRIDTRLRIHSNASGSEWPGNTSSSLTSWGHYHRHRGSILISIISWCSCCTSATLTKCIIPMSFPDIIGYDVTFLCNFWWTFDFRYDATCIGQYA